MAAFDPKRTLGEEASADPFAGLIYATLMSARLAYVRGS